MKISEYRKLNDPLGHCAVIIGIDPGVNTGVAIYRREGGEWNFNTFDFWQCHDVVVGLDKGLDFPRDIGVVIECAAGHVVHGRSENETRGFARDKFAANVGSNRREAELLATRFEAMGFNVVRVRPNRTKWDAAELQRRTGITARTNEHVRDAIRLVWERIN